MCLSRSPMYSSSTVATVSVVSKAGNVQPSKQFKKAFRCPQSDQSSNVCGFTLSVSYRCVACVLVEMKIKRLHLSVSKLGLGTSKCVLRIPWFFWHKPWYFIQNSSAK